MLAARWSRWIAVLIGLWVIAAGSTVAQVPNDVARGPAPDWVVVAPEEGTATDADPNEGLRLLLFDTQVRAEGGSVSTYLRYRSRALAPQALPLLGSVTVSWSPDSEQVVIHHVSIIRDGQTLDALADRTFEILRREQNLEQAMLDGVTTAVLQLSGLRVGDTLDVAYTLVSRDPVIGDHFEQAIDFNMPVGVDRLRYRASWPAAQSVRARAVDDWTPLTIRRAGDRSTITVEADGLQPAPLPGDIPGRFRAVRQIELSDYRDWGDVTVALKPLYDHARRSDPGSPLQAEIARIRALSDDPAVQAAAALRLVQDQVRYVALIMGVGGLTPATADETWERRFGDCKAKTALLLAIFDALGIEAEPAAVSILNGDGMDARLPRVSAFDHVLVRAVVGGRVYWLDGARTGDRRLEDIPVPDFDWALPLTGPQARLEALIPASIDTPTIDSVIAVDASAGLYTTASVEGTMTFRGDGAAALGGQLALLSADQKDQGLRSLWLAELGQATVTEAASSYDVEANVLTLSMRGTMTLDWSVNGLIPPGSTYGALTTRQRLEGRFRDTPYTLSHPTFTRKRSTLRLPGQGQGFRVSGGEVDRVELGHQVRRAVGREGDLVTIDTTLRSLTSEISAADADRARTDREARPYDPPRVFAPANYRPTETDRTALEADTPTTAAAWIDRAAVLLQARDFVAAEAAATEAIALDPESSLAYANRGVARFWKGDRDGAVADLDRASDIDPSERIAMNGHALLAMEAGDYETAVIELSRALRQAPGDEFALGQRMDAYVQLEQYDRALRDMDAIIAGRPDDLTLKLRRIGILETAGRREEADAGMQALVEAFPEDRVVLLNQASQRLERDRPQEALDILNRVLEVDSDHRTTALYLRSRAYLALGQVDLAAGDFDALRAANPDSAVILNNICWAAAEAGVMLEQALRDCDASHALQTPTPNMLGSRARVLLQMGDHAGALQAYEAALAVNDRMWTALYGRGLARIALGETAAGEADKAAALTGNPDVGKTFRSYEAARPQR